MLKRIGAIEQSLEDITGSIRRQNAAPKSAAAEPAEAAPLTATSPSYSFALPRPAFQPPQPPAPATLPTIEGRAEAALPQPKGKFALDLGTAVNFDALRVLWNATKAGHAPLLDGLTPLVVSRPNPRSGTPELHLIVGPLPEADSATRLCGALTIAPRTCQAAPFEGEQLVLTSPEAKAPPIPERRPARAPVGRQGAREPRLEELRVPDSRPAAPPPRDNLLHAL